MKRFAKGYSKSITAVCEDCKGMKETCKTCEGSGMVKVRKQVFTSVTIKPFKAIQIEVQS